MAPETQFLASSSSESDDAEHKWSRIDRHGLRKLRQKKPPVSASAVLSPQLQEPPQDMAPSGDAFFGVPTLPGNQRLPAPFNKVLVESDAAAASSDVLTSSLDYDSPKKSHGLESLSVVHGEDAGRTKSSPRAGQRLDFVRPAFSPFGSAEAGSTGESWRAELRAALGPDDTCLSAEGRLHDLDGANGKGAAGQVLSDLTPVLPSRSSLSLSTTSAANSSVFSVVYHQKFFSGS